jgi:hypothetical protein
MANTRPDLDIDKESTMTKEKQPPISESEKKKEDWMK